MNRKKQIIIIVLMLNLLTACGMDKVEVSQTTEVKDQKVDVVNDGGVTSKRAVNVCSAKVGNIDELSNDGLVDHVLCLIQNNLYSQAKEVIISKNKQDDKSFSLLLDTASALNNKVAISDEYSKLMDRIVQAQEETDNKEVKHKYYDLLIKVNDVREVLTAKELQKYNEKYYNPKIGMTKEQVEKSEWGKPEKVNKTTTKYGVSEQWVYYGGKYIYFEDGKVTSIRE
ncbi:hypothetical protein ASG89_31985 [Paenibacillus sp. Soil766]|uniref:hypothetical protein n=1 Tax=Paenibacillus sp. Soil766 TaxID=1736404 RepID=UPI00070FD10B|nr:hypothetical protein [Paenibacillus sp. Soil766]KRE94913.1 hypothetical protein ASG89_31985 [Paenibacillus sp. Soil766]